MTIDPLHTSCLSPDMVCRLIAGARGASQETRVPITVCFESPTDI